MAKKATNKPEAAQFSAAQKQRHREAALLQNQCARTKVLATGENTSAEVTSVDEEGRMAFLIFLAGESLSRLDNLTWLTPGQAASALARAIVSGLYRIKFSSRQDAVTRFIKGFLANGPEGRMKKYIRGIIAADSDLKFKEAGTSAANIRRRIVARAAARVNRAVTRRPVGQKLELVATSSNCSAALVAADVAAAKAAAAEAAAHDAAYMAAFWADREGEVRDASAAFKAHVAEVAEKAKELAKKAEEAAAAAKAAEEAAAAALATPATARDTVLAEAMKAAGLIK